MAVYTVGDYVIAILLLLLIVWLLSKYVFTRIKLDRSFICSIAPVVVLAISIRVLADAGVYQKSEYWSVTPGIYVFAVLIGAVLIAFGALVESKTGIPYWKPAVLLGSIAALYFVAVLSQQITHPERIFYPLSLALVLTAAVYLLSFTGAAKIFRAKENVAIIFAHMLDASGTFIGVNYYGFSEEHILPEIFINLAGNAAVMIPLKLTVVLAVLYLIEKSKKDDLYNITKVILFILGFGPGARNALLLGLW